jgi:RNA polymerase sigma-70 factor (ECF subfamily)
MCSIRRDRAARKFLRQALERARVAVEEQVTIEAVGPDRLVSSAGELPCDLCVWCGGFRGHDIVGESGLKTDRQGRIRVDPYLRALTDPDVYACLPVEWHGAPPRMSAFFALTTGSHVAGREDDRDVRSPKAFVTTIAARLSLNHLRQARTRRKHYAGPWLPEPVPLGSDADVVRLHDISFAFMHMLERLSPLERAVFILRTAFDCDYDEIGVTVGRSAGACRKAFSRAKSALNREAPRFPVEPSAHRALLDRFLAAVSSADAAVLSDILASDVVVWGDGGGEAAGLKRPLCGRDAAVQFLIASRDLLPAAYDLSVEWLNGAPAAVFRAAGQPILAVLIEARDERVSEVFAIANRQKLAALREADLTSRAKRSSKGA